MDTRDRHGVRIVEGPDTRLAVLIDALEARLTALESAPDNAALDVRLTCLEQMLIETDSDEFEQFYKKYPHKKAPRDAAKAFKAARKRASFEEIMAGLVKYIKHKPPKQSYAYPASWLNADCWLDDHDEATLAQAGRQSEGNAPQGPVTGPQTEQAIEALTQLVGDREKAEAIRNHRCGVTGTADTGILIACASTHRQIEIVSPFFGSKPVEDMLRMQGINRDFVGNSCKALGYPAIDWPETR